MVANLYDVLEIPKDASPEQIRKAYKKKALQTHPDRLPQGATPADKADSEEQFRKVNNAYEVLNDPQNRRMYDLHGVWPPPEPEHEEHFRRAGSSRARYPGNYNASRNGRPERDFAFPDFVFTDPFTLFESIFGDFSHHHRSPFDDHRRSQPHRSEHPFERVHRMHSDINNYMANIERDMFPSTSIGFPSMSLFPVENSFSNRATFGNGGRARWAKESMMTTTVNGVTQSVHKRRDWDGTEHVTRTYPDGREVHMINGIEQPSTSRFLPYPEPSDARRQPTQTVVGQQRSNTGSDYVMPPPPPYPGHGPSGGYSSSHQGPEYDRRRDRRYSESPPVVPNMYARDSGPVIPDFNHHGQPRKRWWRGGR